ncbi:hypothetical protein [Candidatus Palauibacter sp.]|uniref:hypothetical protein n=1 Tax=Candidatus Palauibacter sp. TaxID=3101350 RepID=UPI003AF2B031
MSRRIQRCLIVLFVLFVVVGIGFGASQASGSVRLTDDYCGAYESDLGCCPPHTGYSCFESCVDLGYWGGACMPFDPIDDDNDDDDDDDDDDENKPPPCEYCCTCLF